MRGVSGLAIKKPATTIMLIITMIFMGLISLVQLPMELTPDFNLPIVSISTVWVGTTPEDIDDLVTREIEDALSVVDGVKSVTSSSRADSSSIVVEFDFGVDADDKVDEVEAAINKISYKLPDDADDPLVQKVDINAQPVLYIDFIGDNLTTLRTFAEDYIEPELDKVSGVGSVTINGGYEEEVQVLIDPYLLSSYGLDAQEVYFKIDAANINIPMGTLESGNKEYLIKLNSEISTVEELGNIVISNDDNGIIRLKDISTVELTNKRQNNIYRVDGRPAISISLTKAEGGNIVDLAESARKELLEIEKFIPNGTVLQINSDDSTYIKASIGTVTSNAITGLVLASVIIFIFLRSFKLTLVIALAIPTSIIFTFLLLERMGVTINVISLMGLSLGVGMLVDNSVVVLDNIHRHYHDLGADSFKASEDGANEIAIPILASTATTVAVFVPLVMNEGIIKEIFKDMSYSITFALISSLIIALTFVPMMTSKLLTKEDKKIDNDHFVDGLKPLYRKWLKRALIKKRVTLGIVFSIFIASFFFAFQVGSEFMPAEDEGRYSIDARLPKGVNIDYAKERAVELEAIFLEHYHPEETESYAVNIHSSRVSINVNVVDKAERKRSVFEIVDEIRPFFNGLPDLKLNIRTTFGGPPSGGISRDFIFEVYSTDHNQLDVVADHIYQKMLEEEHLADIINSSEGGGPQIDIELNRDRLKTYGLSVSDVARPLSYQIIGGDPISIKKDGNETDVTVKSVYDDQKTLDALKYSSINTPSGSSIKIEDVATIKTLEGTPIIEKKDKIRKVTLGANVTEGYSPGEAKNYVVGVFEELNPPSSVTYGFGGDTQSMQEATGQLFIAIFTAIFLVYFILVAQFESFIYPFIIVGTVPLSLIGVFFGVFLTQTKISVMVMVGIIMLIGIVVNNAIVLIDYIQELRLKGMEVNAAIVEAGETRLRPILMTTLTTVIGMIPLALSTGDGSETYKGMAIAVIFGLSFATVLTLIIIPTFYLVVEDLKDITARKKAEYKEKKTNQSEVEWELSPLLISLIDLIKRIVKKIYNFSVAFIKKFIELISYLWTILKGPFNLIVGILKLIIGVLLIILRKVKAIIGLLLKQIIKIVIKVIINPLKAILGLFVVKKQLHQ